MADPNIYLVRHAVSEANLDKALYLRLPDQRVPLAPEGFAQARAAGAYLADQINDFSSRRVRILCSPYLRARQTAAEIAAELVKEGITYDIREDIALREMSFGLFDGYADEELAEAFPAEYQWYQKHLDVERIDGADGEFWAAVPLGESRAQVADRVRACFGGILRGLHASKQPITDYIVVSHGVTLRCFIMQWLHHPFEWYGRQPNPNNASVHRIADGGAGWECDLVFDGFIRSKRSHQDIREQGDIAIVDPTASEAA